MVVAQNPHYTLKTIDITTGRMLTTEKVKSLTGIREGTNIYSHHLANVRRDFLRAHPNVRDIRIERVMPDTIRILVIEREPKVKMLGSPGRVIDFDGYIFVLESSHESMSATLPSLKSSEWTTLQSGQRASERVRQALRVLDVIEGRRMNLRIVGLDTTSAHFLVLQTEDRREIALPWGGLKNQDGIVVMLTEVAVAMASPHARGYNRFEANLPNESTGKVYAQIR